MVWTTTEDAVMEYVEEDDAEMANEIRKLMFVFDDLTNVDDTAMRDSQEGGRPATHLRIENRHRRYEGQDLCQPVSASR